MISGPARVHTIEHFGPILTFGTAGSRLKGEDGIPMVIFSAQHIFQLQGFQLLLQHLNFRLEFLFYCFPFLQKLLIYSNTVSELIKLIPMSNHCFFLIQFFHDPTGLIGVIPKIWILRLLLQLYYTNLSLSVVKDTP